VSLPIGLGGGGGYAGTGGKGDKSLALPLTETIRLAWLDPDLRQRILFVLFMFSVFALGVHVPVPIPGVSSDQVMDKLKNLPQFQFLDMFSGGALRRLSIFALGLTPYITASIIMQIMQTALPNLKKEMQEGGEYARKKNNERTRLFTLVLCAIQGFGLLQMLNGALPIDLTVFTKIAVVVFWTSGAMFQLWLGEQISEKGIGNGISLMIFAGIILSLPQQAGRMWSGLQNGVVKPYSPIIIIVLFLGATWLIVYFTTAQRRIPIQHMKRTVGTKVMGGSTSYLPLSVNMAGVMPIIFAVSLIGMPLQFGTMAGGEKTTLGHWLLWIGNWTSPGAPMPRGLVGCVAYTALIFFFTYFWTAIQYNVEDISNNLKRGGSFIPGVRPGKQTKDFLDGVISRITVVGAGFISIIALMQFISPQLAMLPPGQFISVLGGTSLLIMVSVALETMRQVEANLLMKQYGS
jgi:preprotein translocase subunit SecY